MQSDGLMRCAAELASDDRSAPGVLRSWLLMVLAALMCFGCGRSAAPVATVVEEHALIEAVEAKDVSALQTAIERDARLLNLASSRTVEIGRWVCHSPTALVLAAATGWEDGVSALLDAGVVVDGVDGQRRSPLEWAAGRTSCLRCVELLLDAGADPNHTNEFGATPLHHAAWNRSTAALSIVRLLVESGARVGSIGSHHMTPLTAAIESQQAEVVSYLLSVDDSDLNAKSVEGMTPLLLAMELHEDAIVLLLLEAGAETRSATPGMGHSVLHQLCARRQRGGASMARALMDHGSNPNARDIGGHTPLMVVGGSGDAELVATLVEGGADPWAEDDDGLLALDFAVRVDDALVGQALVTAMMGSVIDPSGGGREQLRIRQAVEAGMTGPLGSAWKRVLDSIDGSFLIDD